MATTQSRILGPNGKPILTEVLDQEIAAGGLTGIRQVWRQSAADNLTPGRLAAILRAAAEGSADEYLTLAEEMEERDMHYASVLCTRKLAIAGLGPRVDALSDQTRDVEIADAVREMISAPWFGDALFDLADGLGKGYSVCEIVWDRSGKRWAPAQLPWRDPRFFVFDRETGQQLRLLDDADPANGIELAPYKFICHRPKVRSGLPIRGGLARLAAVAYMCKAWTWKDWMSFADIFGLPMRVGRYGPNATKDDIATLMSAVANLGSDAAAVMPESTNIQFQAAPNTAGAAEFFQNLANWWDKQISKGVLGQTMTADDGASLSQARVHNEVRIDLLKADARALQNTLNRDLVRPFVDLNFGPGRYPMLVLPVPEPEDLKLLIEALETLVPMGLEVEQSVIRDKLNLPDPATGADVKLLRAPSAQPAGQAVPQPALNRAANRETTPVTGREAQLADLAARRLDPLIAGWIDDIEALVRRARSIEDIRDGLLALLPDLNTEQFGDAMQTALAIAGVAGMGDARDDADA